MNKNQNGFATLEIILIIGIIAIFSTVAVPKMARILDKVALDYELKHLYSDLNFARSIGKSSTFDGGIFPSGFDNTGNGQIEFWLYSRNYSNSNMRNRYQIMRQAVTSSVYYRHKFTNNIFFEFKSGDYLQKVTFNNKSRYDNWSKTLQFSSSSKLNKTTAEVKFDSVGRWRGSYVK